MIFKYFLDLIENAFSAVVLFSLAALVVFAIYTGIKGCMVEKSKELLLMHFTPSHNYWDDYAKYSYENSEWEWCGSVDPGDHSLPMEMWLKKYRRRIEYPIQKAYRAKAETFSSGLTDFPYNKVVKVNENETYDQWKNRYCFEYLYMKKSVEEAKSRAAYAASAPERETKYQAEREAELEQKKQVKEYERAQKRVLEEHDWKMSQRKSSHVDGYGTVFVDGYGNITDPAGHPLDLAAEAIKKQTEQMKNMKNRNN